jgi:hypothetical protein
VISKLVSTRTRRITVGALTLAVGAALGVGTLGAGNAKASGDGNLFITSAIENAGGTVTLPLHEGLSGGQPVWYVIADTSDGNTSQSLGVNTSQKLANAANTAGVEKVTVNSDGAVVFPATVNFNPTPGFALTAGPAGFPPATANPPAVGNAGYSPLIQLPNGVVENAPQASTSAYFGTTQGQYALSA